VHTDGDWHRAVHIWIYNSQGNLVLQKRAAGKDTFPGRWDVSVGGHVTSGDSVLETALKEVREELGIDINVADLEALGTLATAAKGSSPVGGDFTCNEFKDIFLLKFDGDVSGVCASVRHRRWRCPCVCVCAGGGLVAFIFCSNSGRRTIIMLMVLVVVTIALVIVIVMMMMKIIILIIIVDQN